MQTLPKWMTDQVKNDLNHHKEKALELQKQLDVENQYIAELVKQSECKHENIRSEGGYILIFDVCKDCGYQWGY